MGSEPFPAEIILVPMSPGRVREFAQMLEEYRAAGELDVYQGDLVIAWNGYAAFYELLSGMKAGGFPMPEYVPMDSYFIEEAGRILGEVYIRHRLNPRLEQFGGHIGYKVRPTCRNRGVATAALRLALHKLGEIGVEKALVTCNINNIASARVIEKCGGVRTSDTVTQNGVNRRYWISTSSFSAAST